MQINAANVSMWRNLEEIVRVDVRELGNRLNMGIRRLEKKKVLCDYAIYDNY